MKENKGEFKQIKKIFKLTINANLLFLVWDFVYSLYNKNYYFIDRFTLQNILNFIIFNDSPLGDHLWYLGAILYVLIIVLFLDKIGHNKILFYLTPILLLGDLALGKYSLLLWGREFPYILVRNFLFVGIPYFSIGIMIDKSSSKIINKRILVCLIIFFSFTTILERYTLLRLSLNATRDHYISTTFLAVSVFLLTVQFRENKNNTKTKLINYFKNIFSIIGCKYSSCLYIIHPIFITCTGALITKIKLYSIYQWFAPVWIYTITVLCLIFLDKLKFWTSKKIDTQ